MKKDKDKEKYQPTPEPTTVGGSKEHTSSALITLQLLNKEKEKIKEVEKKESAAEAAKSRCRTCFKEIAPTRRCFGHSGGGSDGSSGKTSEEKASTGEDKSLAKSGKVVETMDELSEFASMGGSEELDVESSFAPEIIADLIAKRLLLVDSDRDSMTLTIKLLCEPDALTEEQREQLKKFMEAIIKEFNEFKEENHLSDDCMQMIQDEDGNILSLRFTMGTLALYDAFIQRLANNLVTIPNPELQDKYEARMSQSVAPNPFSVEPKPCNKDKPSKREEVGHKDIESKKTEDKEEEQQIFNPSPFNMKPW